MGEINLEDVKAWFEQIPHWPKNTQIGLMAGLALCVVLAFLGLGWWPSVDHSIALDDQTRQTLSKIEKQMDLLRQRRELKKELALLSLELPRLQKALPDNKELPLLLSRLNRSIEARSLTLGEFKPLKAKDNEVLTLIPIKLSIEGDGQHVAQIPNLIAESSRRVSLNKFDISFDKTRGQWLLQGVMTTFAQKGVRLATAIKTANANTNQGAQ